ncbi:trifunctional serine/threonine-protein kinase/ATP-binding protein/sensor histidine kinase [Alkalinema pantanalense CENA528]|uniref:trifunctional serine/threonine-protein kinase/ATP-binding protein/sensor histidine kinase n=1 Tax=Alkalinema pantanalense TaxID=1620705 RepID=UPI003D6F6711
MTLSATTTAHSFPKVSGYRLVEQLYLGSRTAVYRAVQTATQKPVVIKVLRREHPSFGELVQFRNQYTIAKNLPIPGIVQPLNLEPLGNGYGLVMEDWGGVSLGKYIEQQALELTEVLEIALRLADILHDLSQHRVVHKDIKPANILIQPQSKQIKLIDFSIASLLPRETQAIQSVNILEGTLAYLAPEQTGRMNRGIDYRADFYALGVTLYQLLTGTLPFFSHDPLALMHCHIAKTPVPVDQVNPAVPVMVAAIVHKLMAKNAEDRYQSALGLKHDLEQCLTQWQTHGEIVEFELGQYDLSDRFLIPEKLYGREQEVAQLLAAFERVTDGTSELMLVAGFSGIGKTAVVNEVHKPIVRQRGYFIKGKFDQFNRNIPLSAFVQALRDLMGQLLSESDAQLAQWKAQILEAVGENGQVLIDVIPELELIIGQQPIAPELSGSAAQNRFNLLFQKFIEVFTTAAHPLVVFLDDLQWTDSASLQLIKLLMSKNRYLLMLGAYRDNEVSPVHPFILTVDEIRKANAIVNTITLAPLDVTDTNHLVADTLKCSRELAQPLTELIDRKTQGNPFFATQFLKALHEDGLITFNRDCRYWKCDIAAVNARSLSDDVVDFMALQLQKLPESTQTVLKLAACIGNQFDLETLAIVSEQSATDVATALWKALQEGLILPTSQIYKFFQGDQAEGTSSANPSYRFLHDRVQQAAYSFIPEVERATAHYQIGQLLRKQLSPTEQEERLFELVNHLNYGSLHLRDCAEQDTIVHLNLAAGQKARAATAYQAAHRYAQIGINLLGQDRWQYRHEQTLALHELAAEAAYLEGEFGQMEQWIEAVLTNTRIPREQATVYRIRIQAFVSQNNFTAAIATGRVALQQFNIHLPEQPTPDYIQQEFQSVLALIGDRPIETLFDLPKMQDADQIAILGLATSLIPVCYMSNSPLFPVVIALTVKRSIEFGNAAFSCMSYSAYGILLIMVAQEIELATCFGRLAHRLAQEPEAKKFLSNSLIPIGLFIHHRTSHIQGTLPMFQTGYQVGIETGALEDAGYNAEKFCWHAWWCGYPLPELETQIRTYHQQLLNLSQVATASYCAVYLEMLLSLLGQPEAQVLASEHAQIIEQKKAQNDLLWVYTYYLDRCLVNFILGDTTQAEQAAIQARIYFRAGIGTLGEVNFYFYDSLITLAHLSTDPSQRDLQLQQVRENQAQLQQWAHHAPMNYLHKWQLVEAECLRVTNNGLKGERLEAIDLYDLAIAGATENGYIQEAALAQELAAKFYLAWGKAKFAAVHLQEAYYGYAYWGAQAKVADLEQRYPDLLHPILNSAQNFNSIETLATIASTDFSIHTSTHASRSSTSSVNTKLDFETILKASQSLSGTMQLDQLLHQLSQIILQHSGADRCALILPNAEGAWEVQAIATPEETQLCHALLQNHSDLPTKLIYYVKNTQETVIIDDCKTKLPVIDEYLNQHTPKSILCLPILNQGNLTGILYLQNQLTRGVFTRDRIATLQLLTSQAAISLENARLYQQVAAHSHTLEAEVDRKTHALHEQNQALEQTLHQLQHMQAQLIHAEKMSSLGQMVAGIAHEINNPINFIKGNITYTQSYLADLVSLLNLYQQEYPQPTAAIAAKREEIDLDFLVQDLSSILDSMKIGSDRIRQIVLSLRNFARLDEADLKTVNLHEGIENTLLIVQHRCQGSNQEPVIQVVKDYGTLPAVTCYPSQLNQVFLHLLNNAIDAIRENSTLDSIPEIRIRTRVTQTGQVSIQIANTHSFIPEAIQTQIFNPFFTTKPIGQGAGLGLSVSYAIVQKHQGTLTVRSQPEVGTEFQIEIAQSVQPVIA